MSDGLHFHAGRGCIAVANSGSSGFLYELTPPISAPRNSDGLILITNIAPVEQDITTPKDALDDTHALYYAGTTMPKVRITGIIYLGAAGKNNSAQLVGAVDGWFQQNRVTSRKEAIQVNVSAGYKSGVFIDTLAFGESDSNLNTITFIIEGYAKPRK